MLEKSLAVTIIIALLAVLCSSESATAVNFVIPACKNRIIAALIAIATFVLITAMVLIADHNPFATWR